MRKSFFTITLTVLLIFALMPTAALAAEFIESPSTAEGPILVSYTSSNPDWDGELILTPYRDRNTLPEEELAGIEAAYGHIVDADQTVDLHDDIEAMADELGVDPMGLAVSSLFNLHATKDGYGTVTVVLESDKFENYVTLLHFNGTDWDVVDPASVDGNRLTFSTDNFSPFAVVVHTDEGAPDSPQTGEAFPWALLAGAVLAGTFGAGFLYLGRKKVAGI